MNDVVMRSPQLSHCPYCGKKLDGECYVGVYDEPMPTIKSGDEPPSPEDLAPEITRCIRFSPCGHAFEESSIDEITDELHKLRNLKSERRRCEDPERLKELDYELEAQVHAVNNRASEAIRRPKADGADMADDE